MPGLKFNPLGRRACGDVVTAKIEEIADRMMGENVILEPVKPENVEKSILQNSISDT